MYLKFKPPAGNNKILLADQILKYLKKTVIYMVEYKVGELTCCLHIIDCYLKFHENAEDTNLKKGTQRKNIKIKHLRYFPILYVHYVGKFHVISIKYNILLRFLYTFLLIRVPTS